MYAEFFLGWIIGAASAFGCVLLGRMFADGMGPEPKGYIGETPKGKIIPPQGGTAVTPAKPVIFRIEHCDVSQINRTGTNVKVEEPK